MTSLPLAAALIAVLELDAAHAAQLMVGRPMVFAPLLGWAFGEAAAGLAVGVVFELLSLEVVPVGAVVPPSPTVSAGAALLLTLAGGAPLALAVPGGLAVGRLHRIFESKIRQERNDLAERVACEGAWLGSELAKCGAKHAAATGALLLGVLALLRPVLAASWELLPPAGRAGFDAGVRLAPCLGIAVLVLALRGKA